jgi:PAS domain S-box-containing protein/diguanylate cyclase (GGDEF)-like protein
VGALFYSIPVRQSLFALLGRWPTPSGSGETVLMRREAEGIRILYASRLADSNGLGPLLPMAQSNLVSVRLANGEKGIISGALDYKRQPVITYGEPIADTPWTLVTKIDQREVEAPVEKLARGVALAGGLLLLAAGLAIWLWSRAQVNRQRAQLLGKELERQVLERRFDFLSRYANDAFLLLDTSGRILEINQRASEMSGYAAEELIGAPASMLRSEDQRGALASRLEQTLAHGQSMYEAVLMHKDGRHIPVEVSARLIEQEDLQRIHIGIRDISERKQNEEKLALATYFDALTGLPNARKLLTDVAQAIAAVDANAEPLALLVLNLDRFAQLNESLGRAAGDQVLVSLAQRWAAVLSVGTLLARLDGDQFAVLWLGNFASGEAKSDAVVPLLALANDLLASMAEPVSVDGQSLPVALTLSIGVALYPADAPDAAALLHAAEDAMRIAKAEKGNQVRFFDRAQAQTAIDWFDTESALRLALERDELFLVYQPQVEASNGRVIAAESLIRWRRNGEVVPPGRFIHVVEGTDLAEPVSRWVLQTACRQARLWLDRNRPLRVAVNIFSDHVISGRLLEDVQRALADAGLPPEWLEIEVVESSLLRNPEVAAHTLREIKRLGVSLALDDFGTGYSSLGYLKHYPFDVLKIDQLFTRNVTRDPEDAAIVRATIALAHNLGMRVLAEGVETEPQLRFMTRYGCDHIQGYLTSHPIEPEAVETLVMERRDLRPAALRQNLAAPALLIVEDEPIEAEMLALLLQDAGYATHVVADLAGALMVMGKHRVDLVISDHYLEQATGVEVLERLRRLFPDVPAIMVSSTDEQSVVIDAVNRAGIRAFLPKPVEGDSLLDCVRALLAEAAR